MEMTKTCSRCVEVKPFSAFHKEAKSKDGHQRICKDCTRQCNSRWDAKNPGKRKILRLARYHANRDEELAKRRPKYAKARERASAKIALDRANDPKRVWATFALNSARRRAKRAGLPFDLTLDHLLAIAGDTCPALNIPLRYPRGPMGAHRLSDRSATVDRIIPYLGYVCGNVAVLSARANRIKADAALHEIEAVARWLLGALEPRLVAWQ